MTILTSTWIWSFFLFLALDRSEKNSMCYLDMCARARQKFDMAENESIQFVGKKIKKLNFYLDFAFLCEFVSLNFVFIARFVRLSFLSNEREKTVLLIQIMAI